MRNWEPKHNLKNKNLICFVVSSPTMKCYITHNKKRKSFLLYELNSLTQHYEFVSNNSKDVINFLNTNTIWT